LTNPAERPHLTVLVRARSFTLALLTTACAAAPIPRSTPVPAPPLAPALTPTLAPASPPAPAPTPLAELMTRAGETFSAALKSHDKTKLVSLYTPDACIKLQGHPDLCTPALASAFDTLWLAFPDARSAWGRTWHKGDVSIAESAWTGTNEGPGPGASKKPTLKVAGAAVVTLTWFSSEGRIREQHVYADEGSVLMQLGIDASGRPFDGLPTSRERHDAAGAPAEENNAARVKEGFAEDAASFTDDAELVDFAHAGSLPAKRGAPRWIALRTYGVAKPKLVYTHVFGIESAVITEYEVNALGKRNEPVTLHGVEVLELADGKIRRGMRYRNSMELTPALALPIPVPSLGGAPASTTSVALRSAGS
jgi:hypothetical protein